ncbi:protein kinase family protein [Wenzhouxiangella sp. XN79A]|uniref:protein kinase family protein n=1 Tax=Wenzhouxiangella sp. XN79A TaxID=2724193 RepID=UPI00144AE489|nr:protein kinase family protein [Wenzhouxiangella sp. XN79A]NKI36072.1 protein kinase family protein [Wenzhouxiangella sp. XN79A]
MGDPATNPPPAPEQIHQALCAGALKSARPLARGHQGWLFGLAINGYRLAVKTPAGGAGAFLHRRTLRREHRAYRRLDGLPGFARCHGLFDDRWLVLDEIDGRPFRDASADGAVGADFFDRLLEVVRAMHERGVAHGDFKRKSNLMVDAEGRPWIVDLGTAVLRRDRFAPLNHALFRTLAQTDLNAWVKLKYGGYAGVSEADRALLRPTLPERLARAFRRA